jgi:ankyrin repeat protein
MPEIDDYLSFTMVPRFSNDHEHHDYTKDEDIPFTPDGHHVSLGGNVEKVKRTSKAVEVMRYARKTITIDVPDNEALETAKRRLMQEARILHHARHGHVVQLIMTYFYEHDFAMIMERADGNLNDYLIGKVSHRKTGNLSRCFGCLIGVVAYIHGFGIRHRDIKPTNILIKGKQVLLADFGISRMGLGKTMPTTIPAFARDRTKDYCAPEVEDESTRGRSADIFSLGAVFLEMLIAHTYPHKRRDLEDVLTSRGNHSYAKTIDLIHHFIHSIEQELGPDKWFLKVLSHCRKMLYIERDQRPPADDLDLAWSSLLSSDRPLTPCRCLELVSATGSNRLVESCKKGSLEEVEILLAQNVDPNTLGAIHQASARGFGELVYCFLDHEVNINLQDYSRQTPLHCAAGYGHRDIVELLLEKGADIELKDDEGQTVLQCAAGQGYPSIVEMLLSRNAVIQAKDGEGRTALHFAARRGHDGVVIMLLEKRADPALKDAQGRTALHFAAGYGSEKVVERLLELPNRDTINLQDRHGQTALHFAARGKQAGGKYEEVRKMLTQKGADRTLTDRSGRTVSWYLHQNEDETKWYSKQDWHPDRS